MSIKLITYFNRKDIDSQLIENFKAFAEKEENRERIEIEIICLSKDTIGFLCKLIQSTSHVRKVTLTSIQG